MLDGVARTPSPRRREVFRSRWSKTLLMTAGSMMKARIFIGAPHRVQVKGSTS